MLSPHGTTPKTAPNVHVLLDNAPIPTLNRIKILGLVIQSNRRNTAVLHTLSSHVTQIIGLLRRVTARGHGPKEKDRCRFIQAFLLSRITYSLPYLSLSTTEVTKVDGLIRKAYRAALGLPPHASTAKLWATGTYNSLAELIEAHRTGQINRLAKHTPGQLLLKKAQIQTPLTSTPTARIPPDYRDCITIRPLPRNMNPTYNTARRAARARALVSAFPPS